MSDQADKKHAPSDLRRRQAREEGRFARSQMAGPAAVLLAIWLVLGALESSLFAAIASAVQRSLSEPLVLSSEEFDIRTLVWRSIAPWALAVAPMLAAVFAAALVAHWAQCGWVWLPNRLAPDWTRMAPSAAWQRIASGANLWRTALALLQLSTLACIAWLSIASHGSAIFASREPSLALMSYGLWRIGLELLRNVAFAWIALAAIDYGIQRWLLERALHMTDDEVREENRRMQGDPHVRRQRRQLQQTLANQRTTAATSSAASPNPQAVAPQVSPTRRSSSQADSSAAATGPGKL